MSSLLDRINNARARNAAAAEMAAAIRNVAPYGSPAYCKAEEIAKHVRSGNDETARTLARYQLKK